MAWKTLTTHNFNAYYTASSKATKLNITVQYDDSKDLATTLKIRFVAAADKTTTYKSWGFWLYWKPNKNGKGTMERLKGPGKEWPTSGYPTFTLTKDYDAAGFTIPKFWVCCTGYPQEPYKENDIWYIEFGDLGKQTCWKYFHTAAWFDGSRQNFKIEEDSRTETGVAKKVSDNSAGTCSITDNGNNTFTLKGTKGAAGTNNTASGPTLTWGYDTKYSSTFKTGDTKDLTISKASDNTRTVYAKSVTGSKYGDNKTKTASLAIKQYVAPSKPGKPSISWTKSRMTVRENWTISWGAATKTNDNSAVAGYRIRVFVNGTTIPIKNNSSEVITTDNGDKTDKWRYYYERDKTDTSMTFYTPKNDIAAGDTVKVVVHAFSKDAKSKKYYSEYITSDEYTVCNSGIMYVKVSGAWKEGIAYYKTGGAWKEAETVNVKVSGSWKEST